MTINEDKFCLKNHASNDLRCYDILKDIQRLENYVESKQITKGFSIVLTNVKSLWNKKHRKMKLSMTILEYSKAR